MGKQKSSSRNKSFLTEWRSRLTATVKADPVTFAILLTGALLAAIALSFYFVGFIRQNIMGEAFYDFQFAYRNSFTEGWKVFFFERIRSRVLHGVLVSALFHGFGFNPPAFYLGIFLLIIATAVCIALSLCSFLKSPGVAAWLVAAFAWLPLNIIDLIALKKAHHALAWFAFWLAVLLWQKWSQNRRIAWLFAATIAFLTSILAYEVAIALLPVAVFLSLPALKNPSQVYRSLGMALWITLLSGLAFLNLERLKPYSGVEAVYAAGGWDLDNLLQNALAFLPRLPSAIWSSGLLENPAGVLSILAQFLIGICILAAILALWNSLRNGQRAFWDKNLALVLSGLWLAIATYLPFILAGQPPDSDGLRGAAFGFLLFALAGAAWMAQQGRERVGNVLLGGICLFWIAAGLLFYTRDIRASQKDDFVLQNVAYTLRQQVPDVAEGTTFVFVNAGVGRTGCIGFMNMLYDRSSLHCIHLLSGDTQESYTRTEQGLQERGGRLWPERFLIVTFDGRGIVKVLDQLDSDDIPELPITWASPDPLLTNRSLIYETISSYGRNFDFYNYMVSQRSTP